MTFPTAISSLEFAMLFEGTSTVLAPSATVWDFLLDPDNFADCMPGVKEVKRLDDRSFEGVISASVGPMSGQFTFRTNIVESDPPRELNAIVEGTDSVTRSTVRSEVTMTLDARGPAETHMAYKATVDINGRLAILGDAVLRATAALMLEEYMRRVRRRLESKEA